jgi:hypothetical protein
LTARARLAWLALFGVAFGWLEGAVVVYLRALLYPSGFTFPLAPLEPYLLATELLREAATLVMLAVPAILAAAAWPQRVAAFFVVFGVWDLVYYATLYLVLGWPASLSTPDVLFLIPWPWVGPVWAPALVAALFIAGGSRVFLTPQLQRAYRAGALAPGVLAAVVIVWSFLAPVTSLPDALPGAFKPVWFWLGAGLAVGWFWRLEARATPVAAPR